MNAKKFAPLLIALLMGLGAVFVAMNMLSKKGGSSVKHNTVVVAKQAVDAGAVLTDDDLTTSEVGGDALPATAYKNPSDLVGRVAQVPLIPTQVITSTLLAPVGSHGGLETIIPGGMRALTLNIDETSGVAGYLAPGSHVDVLETFNAGKGITTTRTIVQNIQITAIGVHHNPQDPPDAGAGHSATLLVTPVQAELLELASKSGNPRLVLRNGNDLATIDTKGVTFAEFLGKPAQDPVVTPVEAQAPATQQSPIVTMTPTIEPIVQPTTVPSVAPEQWTVQVVIGHDQSEARFDLHPSDQQTTDNNPDQQ